MAKELVTDELWEAIEPLLPSEPSKPKGGRPRVDDRAALTGIVFVLKSGIPWDGGTVDLTRSYYLVLSWHRSSGRYQLHQFDIDMPDPDSLRWSFPPARDGGPGRRLVGDDERGMLLEWYGESGGQLKYYPPVSAALWASEPFVLEPLPEGSYGLLGKAELYFRELWRTAQNN